MKSGVPTLADWAERYESLRRYVLESRQRLESRPLGMALWMTKGMAGWMRQWTLLTAPDTPPPKPAPRLSVADAGPWQQSLTVLLAQMTLQHLQPRVSL